MQTHPNFFPGGQAVFSYVYAIKHGGTPPLTAEVRDYFLDRKDLFNVGQGQGSGEVLSESDWHIIEPETWWRSGRENDVTSWVTGNIDKVWGMLYGEVGYWIPN